MKKIYVLSMLFSFLIVESQSQSVLSQYPDFVLEGLEQYVREHNYSKITISIQKTGVTIEELEFNEEGKLVQIYPSGQGLTMTSSFGGVQMTESFLDELGTAFDYDENGYLISRVVRTEIDGRTMIDSLRNYYEEGKLISSQRYFIGDNPYAYRIKDRVRITEYEYADDRIIKEIKYDRLTLRDTIQILNAEEVSYAWIGNKECRLVHQYIEADSPSTSYVEKKYYDEKGRLILWHVGEDFDEEKWWTRCSYKSDRVMVFESHMETREPSYIREELKYKRNGKLKYIELSERSRLVLSYY